MPDDRFSLDFSERDIFMVIKGLEPGSPVMEGFDRIRDLLVVNILTVLCCIPVVTIGPSLAAMYYCVLKMNRDEEGYASKMFFKAFRENLKAGIAGSFLLILGFAFIIGDFWAIGILRDMLKQNDLSNAESIQTVLNIITVMLVVFSFVFAVVITWFFPVIAKFEAKVSQNISNSFKLGISNFWRTLVMVVLNLVPFVISYYFLVLSPILFFFGLSVPAYFGAKLYDRIFGKLEGRKYA